MAEKNLVEEAIVQIQNLEEAINENAKEILASTMKEEISELVKESMKNEAEEDELDAEINVDDVEDAEGDEDEMEMDMDMGDDEDEMDMDMDMDSDDETIDLTDASDEEVLAVFKKMSNQDSISIEKEGDYIHLDDNDADTEYLIQTESEEEMNMDMDDDDDEDEMDEMYEMNHMDEMDFEFGDDDEEVVYDLEDEGETPSFMSKKDITMYESEEEEEEEVDEIVYEIEMDGEEEEIEEEDEFVYESTKPKVGPKNKLGDAKKSIYKTTPKGGFNEKKAHANPTKGTGKPKFEFKEGQTQNFDIMGTKAPRLSKEEAKEAARTYAFGSQKGRGLRKGVTNNRNLTFENREIMEEVEMLRAKNEEYRKALNLFREKLNEVAIFNSNLAYATRLFTEHSTSKQEKINILRRFDSADTLKESKALYRTIKEELGTPAQNFMNESFEKVIEKAPQSGSAINLIESKTYENPQFMRMKDIMSKIIK
jgi:hypothetical protein